MYILYHIIIYLSIGLRKFLCKQTVNKWREKVYKLFTNPKAARPGGRRAGKPTKGARRRPLKEGV